MKLTDVRRLTGASRIMERPGAAAEAELPAGREGLVVALWRQHMGQLLEALGWTAESVRVRPYPGGASLAVSAPLDALYAATELIERAWEATVADLSGEPAPDPKAAVETLRKEIAEESNPSLVRLAEAAARNGVSFLHGEERVSLGLGSGCRSWPEDALPNPEEVAWDRVHDVPLALVTGTNGKSTTVRLTAAIGAAAGRTVGLCSSDWVRVGQEVIDEGDYSGPGGARRAVRDPRVELAVLEVARGGLLRRGLSFTRAQACLITNVAIDHLGQYGVTDLAAVTETKFLLAKAVQPGGRLILNADDPELVRESVRFEGEITWFSLAPDPGWLAAWLARGGEAAVLEDNHLVLARKGEKTPVLSVQDFPLGMKGAARYNLANALGAIALAAALELPVGAMAEGLAGFEGSPEENPGRGNFLELGGVTVLVDFAHNPHGLAALMEAVKHLPAERRLFLLGQAGDRRDEDIRDLVGVVWQTKPERVVVKEMEAVLRGRAAGEVPALIAQELERLGAPADTVGRAESELEAVRDALAWAQPGDLLILLLHSERKTALALLQALSEQDWRPGQPLPS
jgi:UDP-N-acetylmuramyl tripeptide synthase